MLASTRLRIFVDFRDDLVVAGYPAEEAEDFGAAWRGALAWLCEQLGMEHVSTVTGESHMTGGAKS